MKKNNVWNALISRFFILFNLTKPYERPSKKNNVEKEIPNSENADMVIRGEILPHKQTIMLDEVCGYTKTKVKNCSARPPFKAGRPVPRRKFQPVNVIV